jgi:hypothetical protein
MIELASLPQEHPLRNTPLVEIDAEYRHTESKIWRKVLPTFGIAKKTYNQLAGCWVDYDIWRTPKDG